MRAKANSVKGQANSGCAVRSGPKNTAEILMVAMTATKTTVRPSQRDRKSIGKGRRQLKGAVRLVDPPLTNVLTTATVQEKAENWHLWG